MANSRPSFTKRQKERARQEKQAEKAQKRAMLKQEKGEVAPVERSGPVAIEYDEDGQPKALDFHDF
jgi:hypothetical protein